MVKMGVLSKCFFLFGRCQKTSRKKEKANTDILPLKDEVKSNSLPVEMEVDILSRLSLKQLHRCKCVSKLWHDLISTHDFTKIYRERHAFRKNSGEGCLILVDNHYSFLYNFNSDYILEELVHHPGKFDAGSGFDEIVGSCDGLVCLQVLGHIERNRHTITLLHNPVTGAYKRLPLMAVERKYQKSVIVKRTGFGYDCRSDDYKVLSLLSCYKISNSRFRQGVEEAHLYSLKTNSWKCIKNYRKCRGGNVYGAFHNIAFTNNAFHWLRYIIFSKRKTLASFNLGTQMFHEIPTPEGVTAYRGPLQLVTLKGCLHIVGTSWNLLQMDIYIMKEYGVKESWTKLYHHSLSDVGYPSVRYPLFCNRHYVYSESGHEILVQLERNNKNFMCCNLQSQEVSCVKLCGLPDYLFGFTAVPWIGSFVSRIDS